MFDLKIGFRCNNNCVHCVVANKRESGSLSILQINNLIRSIPDGEREIQITGIAEEVPGVTKELLINELIKRFKERFSEHIKH